MGFLSMPYAFLTAEYLYTQSMYVNVTSFSYLRAVSYSVVHDTNRYERWLSDSLAMLSYRTLLYIVFSQAVRGNSYNMAWDMWIKCIMNKGSCVKSCQPNISKYRTCEMPTDTDARGLAVHTGPSCVSLTSGRLTKHHPSSAHYS